jgi:hypothetical protein
MTNKSDECIFVVGKIASEANSDQISDTIRDLKILKNMFIRHLKANFSGKIRDLLNITENLGDPNAKYYLYEVEDGNLLNFIRSQIEQSFGLNHNSHKYINVAHSPILMLRRRIPMLIGSVFTIEESDDVVIFESDESLKLSIEMKSIPRMSDSPELDLQTIYSTIS